jgi:hypothetical protein
MQIPFETAEVSFTFLHCCFRSYSTHRDNFTAVVWSSHASFGLN